MKTYTLTVPMKVVGKARPRVVRNYGRVHVFTPDTTATAEQAIRIEALRTGVRPAEGPVSVSLEVRHAVPKSFNRVQRGKALAGDLLPTRKPDLDNVIKLALDALNGRAWNDDSQVTDITARRIYAEHEGLVIRVTPK